MSSTVRPKILIFKLAAIGDVALACRAVKQFVLSYNAKCDIHWVIDQKLLALAQALTKEIKQTNSTITFHPVDSILLFKGGFFAKLKTAFFFFRKTLVLAPDFAVILHRDYRYLLPLRMAFWKRLIFLKREEKHELECYNNLLTILALEMGLKKSEPLLQVGQDVQKINDGIGVLVGGGTNQKTAFTEKRWPYLELLILRLLEQTNETVLLFGGPEDVGFVESLERAINEQVAKEKPFDLSRLKSLVGKISLADTPQVICTLKCFVTVDSGLAHIAADVMIHSDQTIFSLFGPTNPKRWKPHPNGKAKVLIFHSELPCSPCYVENRSENRCIFDGDAFQKCMKSITVEQIIKPILQVI